MLSGETAGGDFPIETVTIMRKIVEEAERNIDQGALFNETRNQVLVRNQRRMAADEAYASTTVKSAQDAGAVLIIALANTGDSVRLIAKYRPKATILAVTKSEA